MRSGACIEQHLLVSDGQSSNFGALHETWETSNLVRRTDGHVLAHFNPYFQVRLPSRFHDPAIAPTVGRPIDVCYEVNIKGTFFGAKAAIRQMLVRATAG